MKKISENRAYGAQSPRSYRKVSGRKSKKERRGEGPEGRNLTMRSRIFVFGMALLLVLMAFHGTAHAKTFTVNSDDDVNDGKCDATHCSLREAINAANAELGADRIVFNIPGAVPHTITPESALPTITDPVTINGTTQPCFIDKPIIELDGSKAGNSNGLTITAGNSVVRGLVINRFNRTNFCGIKLQTNGNNVIEGNFIGTDVTGTVTVNLGNYEGVGIHDSPNNSIGGTIWRAPGGPCTGACNLISGNDWAGIIIANAGSTENRVQGNFIGTDVTGTKDLGNLHSGVLITARVGVSSYPSNNTIGGTTGTTPGGSCTGACNLISGNDWDGVQIYSIGAISGGEAAENKVQGNFIGTDVTGTKKLGNSYNGVRIIDAPNNTIGGATAGARNLISGNGWAGISILNAGSTGNRVQGNFIGTDVTGTKDLGNSKNGVLISTLTCASYGYASNNTIGGTTGTTPGGPCTGACNLISGNDWSGVQIFGSDATENKVQGNFIGTDVTGTKDLGNSEAGVFINRAPNNTIGGTNGTTPGGPCTGTCNLISGNDGDGVQVWHIDGDATENKVQGNFIGTDIKGTKDLGNSRYGVAIIDSPNNTIGGTTPAARNLISGNNLSGVAIAGSNATENKVQGNFIGTNVTGSGSLGNSQDGVRISSLGGSSASNNTVGGAKRTTPGGPCTGACNLISGNNRYGVSIASDAWGNKLQGNFIGTDITGTGALPNSHYGVFIDNGSLNTIGGLNATARNLISGNNGSGVVIAGSNAIVNKVQGNFIGTNVTGTGALCNLGAGVYIDWAPFNMIGGMTGITPGGPCTGACNLISGNKFDGVTIIGPSACCNTVRGNDIHNNTGLGIDLFVDGVTPNDPGDGDSGPNDMMNFPVNITAHFDGISTNISGILDTADPTNATVDIYANQEIDPSGFGEGQLYLGNATPKSDGNFTLILSGSLPVGFPFITATATDRNGSTSEFSPPSKPEIKVEGGLANYEGKYKDIVFRRGENPVVFNVTVADCEMPPDYEIKVDLLRKGHKIANISTVYNAYKGKYIGMWGDWKSKEWNDSEIPYKIPVGEYKAKAKIVAKDGTELVSSEEKNFYVIFQVPQSLGNEERKAYLYDDVVVGTRDDESIRYSDCDDWSVPAQRYLKWGERLRVLNSFDEHLFEIVINVTDGEINESTAAEKLMNATSNLIYYTVANNNDIDVMFSGVTKEQFKDAYSGIEHQIITGQCLDYANGLTAIYRTVGIPARVATGILRSNFVFHEWTEAYLENPPVGTDNWYTYDAMDYTDTHTPANDSASPATGSATRKNYYYGDATYEIPVGDQTWLYDGGYLKLNYTYSFVERGNINATDALFEKCENKKYNSSSCTVDPSFDPPIIDLVLDKSEYRIKDSIKANITANNTNSTSLVANLSVTIYKIGLGEDGRDAFGDPILNTSGSGIIGRFITNVSEQIEIPSNSILSKEYIFSINDTYYPKDTYIAQALLKNESINLSEMDLENFDLLPAYEAQTTIPQALPDESFTVTLNLTNVVDFSIENLKVEFSLPSYYNTSDPLIRGINSLSIGGSQIVTWNVTPDEIRNKPKIRFIFEIDSDNGGNQTLSVYHRILIPTILSVNNYFVTVDPPVPLGSNKSVLLNFAVANIGGLNASNINVDILVPENVTATETTWNISDLASGESIYFDTSITFTKPEDFIIDVFASDDANHNASGIIYIHILKVPLTTHTISLKSGWNLISAPLNLTTWELGDESVVGDPLNVTPKNSLTSIYRYNTTSGIFDKCDYFDNWGWWPATGSESFTELEPGRGYWVMAKNDCNLTFTGTAPSDLNMPLNNGWNLIGRYAMAEALLGQEAVVGDPLNVTPKNSVSSIYRYNTTRGEFDKCDHFDDWGWWPATGSESFTALEPGRGYWVMAKNDCMWRHKA